MPASRPQVLDQIFTSVYQTIRDELEQRDNSIILQRSRLKTKITSLISQLIDQIHPQDLRAPTVAADQFMQSKLQIGSFVFERKTVARSNSFSPRKNQDPNKPLKRQSSSNLLHETLKFDKKKASAVQELNSQIQPILFLQAENQKQQVLNLCKKRIFQMQFLKRNEQEESYTLEELILKRQQNRFYLKVQKDQLDVQDMDSENQILVFRFDVFPVGEHKFQVFVQNVSELLISQQNQSNDLYQNAIEANFSHEQMTPLNCILNNARIVLGKIAEIQKFRLEAANNNKKSNKQDHKKLQKFFDLSESTTKQVLYSAINLNFYNENQIQKMKINGGKFHINKGYGDPQKLLDQVIEPFEYQIKNRNIKVSVVKNLKHTRFELDWRLYQLVMFNLIQNAVKYNENSGKIEISINLIPLRNRNSSSMLQMYNHSRKVTKFLFQTTVTNTGSEISKERIPNMMKLFGELKQKQSIHKVKDKGIGVGLTCAKVISNAMDGDLKICENERGFPCTTLQLTIPVDIEIETNKSEEFQRIESISEFPEYFLPNKIGFGENLVTKNFLNKFKQAPAHKKSSFNSNLNYQEINELNDEDSNEEDFDPQLVPNNQSIKFDVPISKSSSLSQNHSLNSINRQEHSGGPQLLQLSDSHQIKQKSLDKKESDQIKIEQFIIEEEKKEEAKRESNSLKLFNKELSLIKEAEDSQEIIPQQIKIEGSQEFPRAKRYKEIRRKSQLRASINVDNLMQGIIISDKDFETLSDQFRQNNKILREFEKREGNISEDSDILDDECVFIEDNSPDRLLEENKGECASPDKIDMSQRSQNQPMGNNQNNPSSSIPGSPVQINVQNITFQVGNGHQMYYGGGGDQQQHANDNRSPQPAHGHSPLPDDSQFKQNSRRLKHRGKSLKEIYQENEEKKKMSVNKEKKLPSVGAAGVINRGAALAARKQCVCQEAILIVDDTEYNLLPLIYYIGQLRIQMTQNIDRIVSQYNSSNIYNESGNSEDEKWLVSHGPIDISKSKKSQDRSSQEQGVFDRKINIPKKSTNKKNSLIKKSIKKSISDESLDMEDDYDILSQSLLSVLDNQIFPEKARNGKEAVEKFEERFTFKCPDENCTKKYFKLVIMDLMMPVMDGFEATEKILALQDSLKDTLSFDTTCDIVALTSNTDELTMERCKKIGFKEVLHKPLDFDSLKRIACLYHFKMSPEEYEEYLKNEKEVQKLSNDLNK